MEETKETKITFYFEENEKSEEEKLRKVSEKIIDEYEEYNDKLLIKKARKIISEYNEKVMTKTSIITFISIIILIVLLAFFKKDVKFDEKTMSILTLVATGIFFVANLYYMKFNKDFSPEIERMKLAKRVIEKYENSKKTNEEKIKIKETFEENKEKSQEVKMMKEYLKKIE
jgi:hypothetical protein